MRGAVMLQGGEGVRGVHLPSSRFSAAVRG